MEICLSAKSLRRAALLDEQPKFKFVVGEQEQEFECARFQACFVSKKVCNILSSDPTLERLRILPGRSCSSFTLIENLWNGESIYVDKNNMEELFSLSRELENDELSKLLVDFSLSTEEISSENCVYRLHLKQTIGLDVIDEISFIASNFYKFDASFVRTLSVSEIEQILQHESLKLGHESALFDIISELSQENDEYGSLFKYIRFEFMDTEHITTFMDVIYPNRIDSCIWESLTHFVLATSKHYHCAVQSTRHKVMSFEYDLSAPLKGFCSALRDEILIQKD